MITPQQAYEASKAKGFYDPIPSEEQRLILIIGELSEAVEAIRERDYLGDEIKDEFEMVVDKGEMDQPEFYKKFIKGTIEEEIADAYIRVLDYMGYKGHKKAQVSPKYRELPDTDLGMLLHIMKRVLSVHNSGKIAEDVGLNNILFLLERFARDRDFDLLWHVEQKFNYNQSRPHKHGKAF